MPTVVSLGFRDMIRLLFGREIVRDGVTVRWEQGYVAFNLSAPPGTLP